MLSVIHAVGCNRMSRSFSVRDMSSTFTQSLIGLIFVRDDIFLFDPVVKSITVGACVVFFCRLFKIRFVAAVLHVTSVYIELYKKHAKFIALLCRPVYVTTYLPSLCWLLHWCFG